MKKIKKIFEIIGILVVLSSCGGGGGGGGTSSSTPTVPTPGVGSESCTDSNASNIGQSLPCSCISGYELSLDGTTCTQSLIPPSPPSGGGTPITYTATYSNYSPTQAQTTPCSGSITATRTIASCIRSSDNAVVANSNCSDPSPSTTVQSKAGSISVSPTNSSLTNGTENLTCSIGQTTGTRAVTCNINYHIEGSTLSTQNCYSNTKVCDTLPTGALSGNQYYSGSAWGVCQISTCNIAGNFIKSGNSCIQCTGGQVAQSNNTCVAPAISQYLFYKNKSAYQITTSGLKVWGLNESGQLGMNNLNNYSTPNAPTFPTGRSVRKIFTEENGTFTFSIMDDGSLMGWGTNSYGQLGTGDTLQKNTPTLINLGSGKTATDLTVGEYSACVILNDATVKCWGYNPDGRLGIGNTSNTSTPTAVNLGSGKTAKKIIMSNSYGQNKSMSCAILNDNTLKCWGYNQDYRLGDGTNTSKTTPVEISVGSGLTVKDVQFLHNATNSDKYSTCSILSNDTLKCWGHNDFGKLGVGDTTLRSTPTLVDLGSGKTVKSIYNNIANSMCAILNDDTLKCWGLNNFNQIGDGSTTTRLSPTLVNLGSGKLAKKMFVYANTNFVLLTDNTLVAWGNNYRGQLGINSATSQITVPTTVVLSKYVKDVALRTDYQACLLYTDNTVGCAGDNIYGSVGNNGGSSLYYTFQSVDLGSGKTAVELYNDLYSNCALLNDSTVKCWGYNNKGQLGMGDLVNKFYPLQTL